MHYTWRFGPWPPADAKAIPFLLRLRLQSLMRASSERLEGISETVHSRTPFLRVGVLGGEEEDEEEDQKGKGEGEGEEEEED